MLAELIQHQNKMLTELESGADKFALWSFYLEYVDKVVDFIQKNLANLTTNDMISLEQVPLGIYNRIQEKMEVTHVSRTYALAV